MDLTKAMLWLVLATQSLIITLSLYVATLFIADHAPGITDCYSVVNPPYCPTKIWLPFVTQSRLTWLQAIWAEYVGVLCTETIVCETILPTFPRITQLDSPYHLVAGLLLIVYVVLVGASSYAYVTFTKSQRWIWDVILRPSGILSRAATMIFPRFTQASFTIVIVIVSVARADYWLSLELSETLKTLCIDLFGRNFEQSQLDWSVVRAEFRETKFNDRVHVEATNPHGRSAALRSAANTYCTALAARLNLVPFFVQMSRSDQRRDAAGSRVYHWAKDVTSTPLFSNPDHTNARVLVDVDYYVDMNELLLEPILTLLYTFVPSRAAQNSPDYDYSYTISNGVVTFRAEGGSQFEHRLWDYSGDCLYIWSRFRFVTYNVERFNVDEDHMIILLHPTCCFAYPFCVLANLEGRALKRVQTNPDFTILRSTGKDGHISVAKAGSYSSTELSPIAFSQLVDASEATTITPAAIQTIAGVGRGESGVLFNVLKSGRSSPNLETSPVPRTDRVYSAILKSLPLRDKPVLTPFMSAFVAGTYVPRNNIENAELAISGRIDKVKSDKASTQLLIEYYTAFAQAFRRTVGKLVPVTEAEVADKQNRPTQRAILERANFEESKPVSDSFIKHEPTTKPAYPRIISTIQPHSKLHYSRYMYAVAEAMKKMPGYAFGRTPRSICRHIAASLNCGPHNYIYEGDFSKMDGHVSPTLRDFEKIVMHELFPQAFWPEMDSLMSKQYKLTGYLLGVEYETGYARASGSPETSVFNSLTSILALCIAYCMHQEDYMKREYSLDHKIVCMMDVMFSCDPRIFWMAGGDDTIMTPPYRFYEKACNMIGQEVKLNTRGKGKTFTFLGRVYGPDAWAGNPNSMCQILRCMSKLHLSDASSTPPAKKLAEKLIGLQLTDPYTPIIHDILDLAREQLPLDYDPDDIVPEGFWARNWPSAEEQWVNEYEFWMLDVANEEMPEFDYIAFADWMDTVEEAKEFKLKLFMNHPPFYTIPEQTFEVPLDINGEVIAAPSDDSGKSGVTQAAVVGDQSKKDHTNETIVVAGVTYSVWKAKDWKKLPKEVKDAIIAEQKRLVALRKGTGST